MCHQSDCILQRLPEYLQAARAASFAFRSLPRLLNMKVCSGLISCMADTRSSDVLAVPSRMCITAVSTVVADVCTRIGYNTTTPFDTLDLRLHHRNGNIVKYIRCNILVMADQI